jgi:NADH dehydrogenase (ubiquinone) 1 alpha subcomplex subunit 13
VDRAEIAYVFWREKSQLRKKKGRRKRNGSVAQLSHSPRKMSSGSAMSPGFFSRATIFFEKSSRKRAERGGQAAMSGVQFRQDMPPPQVWIELFFFFAHLFFPPLTLFNQGFPKIQYRRDLPKRGLSGWGTFAAGAAVLCGGFVVMGMQNRHTRSVVQETRRRRLAIASLLQAEEDRRYLRSLLDRYQDEERIIGGRDDLKVAENPYHNGRYVLPIVVERING